MHNAVIVDHSQFVNYGIVVCRLFSHPIENQSDDCSQCTAGGIGSQVEPFAGAVLGAVLLNEFYAAAHQDGGQPGQQREALPVSALMAAQVLPPDDGARAAVHQEVSPLVEKGDVSQFRHLGRHEPDAEIPDQYYAGKRQWIAPDEEPQFVCVFIHYNFRKGRFVCFLGAKVVSFFDFAYDFAGKLRFFLYFCSEKA